VRVTRTGAERAASGLPGSAALPGLGPGSSALQPGRGAGGPHAEGQEQGAGSGGGSAGRGASGGAAAANGASGPSERVRRAAPLAGGLLLAGTWRVYGMVQLFILTASPAVTTSSFVHAIFACYYV